MRWKKHYDFARGIAVSAILIAGTVIVHAHLFGKGVP